MEIKVLGTGCASCKALYTAVIQAVSETGIEAKVVKVEELTEIMKYNVMSMPALVIDGKVVSSGRKPTVSEVNFKINDHATHNFIDYIDSILRLQRKAKQKLAATGTNRNRRPGGSNLFSWETTLYDL